MSETHEEGLSALLHETRTFPPPADLAAQANAQPGIYAEADKDRIGFWEEQARALTWAQPWSTALVWDIPFAKWFVDGTLNVAVNCVDRHVEAGRGARVAFHWEGEPGDTRTITYADLLASVCQAANALTELGVRAGDKVAIYLPMIPEAVVAMLACARLGAPHTVVFGGFSADALRSRILDCDAHFVITADGGYRRGAPSALKPAVDEAVTECPAVEKVLWCGAPARTWRGTRAATCGGTTWSSVRARRTRPRPSTPSSRSTSCTPVAPRPSPRAFSTPAAAT
jgi:acetyl-CoA synthetase